MRDSGGLQRLPTDDSRERVFALLEQHYTLGNIELEEYERRLQVATNAQSSGDMISVLRDLPELPHDVTDAILHPTGAGSSSDVRVNHGQVRESGSVIAVMSGPVRKGTWRPPRQLNVVAFMGGADLDFRNALMPPGRTEVRVFCMMGGVEIVVPPGLNVEVEGFGFMGAFEDRTTGEVRRDSPSLFISGAAFMGGVEVKVKE